MLIHAAYVTLEASLLVYLAKQLAEEFRQNEELSEIANHINQAGEIDLSYRVDQPEGVFSLGFNEFFKHMDRLVSKVHSLSSQLNDTGKSFSQSTQAMSQGAHTQQQETDLIVTATNQMASAMQEVNQHASAAAEAAGEAGVAAKDSEQSIDLAQATIRDLAGRIDGAHRVIKHLDEESNNIGSVLTVIKGIAEQTNLLALNAAIEAARAGEQGRGFAVVADEVRTLASRTQQSTEEIQAMIEKLQSGSQEAVNAMDSSKQSAEDSVQQTEQMKTRLSTMQGAVETIHSMNQQIAHAVSEQHLVVSEVNNNIRSIKDISQDTNKLASEASRDGEQLINMSSDLRGILAHFKTS